MERDYKITPLMGPFFMQEGPHWDAVRQTLYFVNLHDKEVHSYKPTTGEHYHATVGTKPVSIIIPIENDTNRFVISHGGDVEILTWDGKSPHASRKPYINLEDFSVVRMNDGKASPSGILFVGSMGHPRSDGSFVTGLGNLFAIKYEAKTLLSNLGVSNGLAWNDRETQLYFCDTAAGKTYKYDYDASNLEISNEEVLVDFKIKDIKGLPDGMTIDQDGFLWIACFGGGQVIKVDPDNGDVMQSIPIPSSLTTSVAFGGPLCEDLYCTSAYENLSQSEREEKPHSGYLFKITGLGARGIPGHPVRHL